MMSEKCDEAIVVDTLNIDCADAVWILWLMIRWYSEVNTKCCVYVHTLGYVTAGNSRLARGYQNSVGTHHSHLQSRIAEKNIWKRVSHCIGNINVLLFLRFGTTPCIVKHTYSLRLKQNFSQTPNTWDTLTGFKPIDQATLQQIVFDHHSFLYPKYFQTFI